MSAFVGNDHSTKIDFLAPSGLRLYYHQYSFYSQKVLFALHEKNIPYEGHIVDLSKNAQFEPWFLALNPRAEVPVLYDSGHIITDSSRIIDYIEDKFSNDGLSPPLVPMDQGHELRQCVTHFRIILDQIPVGAITMGSVFHPDLVDTPKLPFIGPIRKLLSRAETNSSKQLRHQAELNPTHKAVLLQKAEVQDKKHTSITDKNEFLKLLKHVENVFDQVEEQLEKITFENETAWLCSSQFTVADISLLLMLERMTQLGLESRFWTLGRRPQINKYYDRAREHPPFKKTLPTTYDHIVTIIAKKQSKGQVAMVCGMGMLAAVAILIGGIFLVKKLLLK